MLKSIGLYFRKIDFLNFAVGAIMPIIVLFIVYSSVKSNIILQDTDFLSLLMNHKGKFIFYFFVSFIEEVIFRGIIFGLLLQKCKNKYLSCVIAALIFTLPHIFNTDNISFAKVCSVNSDINFNFLLINGRIQLGTCS